MKLAVSTDPASGLPVHGMGGTSETADLAPLAAEALRVWDSLSLELGGAAVVPAGTPWSAAFVEVAAWYGAIPVIISAASSTGADGGAGELGIAVEPLRRQLAQFPAVYAVELTGRAETVDLLLEALPNRSRVMFAGPAGDLFTIDYYINVHRKGLHLASTVLAPRFASSAGETNGRLIERASRLLADRDRVQAFQAAVQGSGVGER
jgi:hypothetical protein